MTASLSCRPASSKQLSIFQAQLTMGKRKREVIRRETELNLTDPKLTPMIQAMYGLEAPIRNSELEPLLRELVKTRVSQINGCAYCIDMHMHTKDARAHG